MYESSENVQCLLLLNAPALLLGWLSLRAFLLSVSASSANATLLSRLDAILYNYEARKLT